MANFEQAFNAIKRGKSARRVGWHHWVYLRKWDNSLVIDSVYYGEMVRDIDQPDLMANDWEIKEENK